MRPSREDRSAILALKELASHDDEIVDARSLARPAKLPEAFLSKILDAVGDDAFEGERCVSWREESSITDPRTPHLRWREVRPLMQQVVGGLTLGQISSHGG
ncbi:MAG: hypothetical protein WB297_08525 [Actinomycetota bacterium]